MLFLHKLLPLIVSPLGLVIFLILLALLIRRLWPASFGLGLLIICALPVTSKTVWTLLQSGYQAQSIESTESADAVVVLSGMLHGIQTENGVVTQWNGSVDRFFSGIDLLQAGKAPLIIFTRGRVPWQKFAPEGEILVTRARSIGIPDRQILLTGLASNTADEAHEVKTLMDVAGLEKIILVTSAFHMPRALMLFERAGVRSIPFPTDFHANMGSGDWMDWVPSAGGLSGTSSGIRELIGRLYYRAMFAFDE